jgi:hypothetical protein
MPYTMRGIPGAGNEGEHIAGNLCIIDLYVIHNLACCRQA